MTTRIRINAQVEGSSSSLDDKGDLGRPGCALTSDVPNEGNLRTFTLLAGAAATPVDLGGIAAATLLFVVTRASNPAQQLGRITVRPTVDGAVQTLAVTPFTGAAYATLLLNGPFTALDVSNPSAVNALVQIFIAGD